MSVEDCGATSGEVPRVNEMRAVIWVKCARPPSIFLTSHEIGRMLAVEKRQKPMRGVRIAAVPRSLPLCWMTVPGTALRSLRPRSIHILEESSTNPFSGPIGVTECVFAFPALAKRGASQVEYI